MLKRVFCAILIAVLLVGLVAITPATTVSAATYTKTSQVSGSDFTARPKLAKALDAIFAGNAGIYSNKKCTNLVNTALGTKSVPNNGVNQYVGAYNKSAKNTGTSCWIYANGVYFTLFNEALGNGSPGKNSEKLNLSKTTNKKLTYENLCTWGVRRGVGAQIRVGNHSIIVLGYNESGLTYLDGNGDGKGLVAVRDLTWKQVSKTGAINGTVKYIIQPKNEYLEKNYPCTHKLDANHLCVECCAELKVYKALGTYTVTKKINAKYLPYEDAKNTKNLSKYTLIRVYFFTMNRYNNVWAYTDRGWIYGGHLQRVTGAYLPN